MRIFEKEEYYIKSVSDFLKIKDRLLYTFDPGTWFFRGEDDYTYLLKPSIGRLFAETGNFTTKEKLLHFEKHAFNEFYVRVYNELREKDKFILLAVAQHHGLKTRLLDWTFSPLIALFFAVENDSKHDEDGSLITFQATTHFNNYDKQIISPFDERLEEYHFLFMPDLSPRIRVQQGVFQLFKDPTQEFREGNNLSKFIIPAAHKRTIKRELSELGVSYQTVFPDLDGLCKYINYHKLNNKL
ncbi:FRG domain-containing protein [Pontibacter saemangeumensis]|uniref:FRG domain-containing protein n=1 Tax=Pontibacter saemangeumensis TaxID=1084525 RepID=A0ABP8L5N7_9BACT